MSLTSPKRSAKNTLSLGSILEHARDLGDESFSNLSALQVSVILEKKGVRFADEVELNEISRLRNSMLDDMFYASEDLANFRYEAFMEEAGLDIADFD
jgi:hypothetical protein